MTAKTSCETGTAAGCELREHMQEDAAVGNVEMECSMIPMFIQFRSHLRIGGVIFITGSSWKPKVLPTSTELCIMSWCV